MGRSRVLFRLLITYPACVCMACSKNDSPPRVESAADTSSPVVVVPKRVSNWASEFGQMLVVPSDSENSAVVLYPDEPSATLMASAPLTLVTSSGDTARVKLVPSDSLQCGDAPVVRVTGTVPSEWSVGLLRSPGRLLHMDSIEAMPSSDSARLAADLARLASAVNSNKSARFSGLPFAVLGAHRFEAQGRQYLIGHLARRLNQEAAPLEERTLIIAERPTAPSAEPYAVSYSLRSEGSEDTAEHFEVLAAVQGRQSLLLLLARDQLSQTAYEVIERVRDGSWRTRWARSLAC